MSGPPLPLATIRMAALPGDGIGPEVFPFAGRLLGAANQILGAPRFDVTTLPYDADYYMAHGVAWPPGTPETLARDYDAAFLIALGDPRIPQGGMAHAVTIVLDGFRGHPLWNTNLNLRPTDLIHPVLRPPIQQGPFRFELLALTEAEERIEEPVERSGTAGEVVTPREVHSLKGFEATLRQAVQRAKALGETKVTVVHKNNVFKYSHGGWAAVCQRVASEEGIVVEMQLMDSFLERLVKVPGGVPRLMVTDRAFGAVLRRALNALNEGDRRPIPDFFGLVIGRENIEGMYYRRGGSEVVGDDTIGTQIGRHSRRLVRENIRANIRVAKEHGLSEITVLHVDDVHPLSYRLWKEVALAVASEEGFAVGFMHAGDFVASLIADPASVDGRVFAADNILGDICGDAAAALVGGMGIPATASFNTDGSTRKYFFEPLHGSAPDKAGQGIANPTATLLTVGEIFGAFGHPHLRRAVHRALSAIIEGGLRTQDLPEGTANTLAFGNAVLDEFLRIAGGMG